jgi:DNA-binding MarR family transcriptional regulator
MRRTRTRTKMTDAKALPAIGLGVLLRDGHRAFQHAVQTRLSGKGVTLGEWTHLRVLSEQDGLTQVELCRRIGIQKASSTAIVNSLERRKLIWRSRDPKDLRKYDIYLTPKGENLRETLIPCVAAVNAEAQKNLSAKDTAVLFRIVRNIVDNLSAASNTGSGGAKRRPVRSKSAS